MAMNLIDRPGLAHEELGHPGVSAAGSAALHAAVCVALIAALRGAPENAAGESATPLLPNISSGFLTSAWAVAARAAAIAHQRRRVK